MYYCDKFSHCPIDFSDEPENCKITKFLTTKLNLYLFLNIYIYLGFLTEAKQAFLFPPFIQITSFVVLVAVLVVFLALCILCRLKSVKKKSTKTAKVKKNGHHFNGPPIYYKYSPANSIDYLGNYLETWQIIEFIFFNFMFILKFSEAAITSV